MSKVERAFNQMKLGVSLESLKSEHTQGTLYRAFTKYFKWAEQNRIKLSLRIGEIEKEKNEKEKSLDILSKKIPGEEKRQESLRSQNERLEELVDRRQERFDELVRNMRSMNAEIRALEGRGVTEETITRVGRIDFETGNELTDRIATYEAYNELVGQAEYLKEEIDILENGKENSETELENMDIKITSAKNTLDEEKRKLWTFRESHEIVEEFLKNGYDKEILLSLNEALKALQIPGDTKTSMTRLLDGLKGVKNLDELYSNIRSKSSELKELEERVDETSGTLRAIEENAIKKIRSLNNEAQSELRDLNSDYKDSLKMAWDAYEENVEKYSQRVRSELEVFRKSTESNISKISDHFYSRIDSSITRLDTTLQALRGDVAQWGEMKLERGKHERMMIYGTTLLGVLENPRQELPQVPLEVITRLVDRIASWLHLTNPEAKAKPTDIIAQQDPYLYTYNEYRLVSLLDIVYEYLATLTYRPST